MITFDALDRLLEPDHGGLYTVQLDGLESRRVALQLAPYVAQKTLRIKADPARPKQADPQAQRLTIAGTLVDGLFAGMEATAEWRIVDGEAALLLTVDTGDQQWFRRVALLEDTFFASLRFQAPLQLRISSHRLDDQRPVGISFEAGLASVPLLAGLSFLLPELASNIPVTGTLNLAETPDSATIASFVPELMLTGPTLNPITPAGMPSGVTLSDFRISMHCVPRYNRVFYLWQAEYYTLLRGRLNLTSNGHTHGVPFQARVDGQGEQILFEVAALGAIEAAMDELAALLGTHLSLPAGMPSLSGLLKLTDLKLMLTPKQTPKLQYLVVDVQTNEDTNTWTLIENLFVLQSIDLLFRVDQPFSSHQQVTIALSGLVGVGKTGTLRLGAQLRPGARDQQVVFSAVLADDTTLNIAELFEHLIGHNHPELPPIEIDDLLIRVDPGSKSFAGQIELEGDFPIPGLPKLSLEDVFVALSRSGAGALSFTVRGVFSLAGAQLYVAANYESAAKGWVFAGGTYEGSTVPIGTWFAALVDMFEISPHPTLPATLAGLELNDLGVQFNTATKDFSFHGTAAFPIDGAPGDTSKASLTITADITHQPNQQAALTFAGRLRLLNREFDVAFAQQGETNLLVAAYSHPEGDQIELKALFEQFSTEAAAAVPAGMTISLKHAQLAFGSVKGVSKFLFAVELGAGIELSKLPLVGQQFSRDQTLSMVFQLLAANADFEADEITRIGELTGAGTTTLPAGKLDTSQQRVRINGVVRLGDFSQTLDLPLGTNAGTVTTVPPDTPPAISAPDGAQTTVKWFTIQKAFGPFHFDRLGIGLSGANLVFLLDASLAAGGLTLTLEGLAAEAALADLSKGNFRPTFHLNGLGLDFRRGDLEIGGALLRQPTADPDQYQYDGAVTIHYKKLGILALGSYRMSSDNHPSLFIYALIDYPLGGPPFFFVEGLALGFGYNRTLQLLTIDAVSSFPLVAQAIAPPTEPATPMQMVEQLRERIPLAVGHYFLAVGIKFHSFKHIQGFVLLALLFGEHFEIDVLGMGTLTVPPKDISAGEPPLMVARLTLLARFLPDEGFLGVQAKLLPDAHVFSPDCHVTGGFAFFCWFAGPHRGDFALTLGGYHSAFSIPDHYPRVPRLGLNWQVTPNLSVKADAYFALTPAALMAGGHLEAVWQSGNLLAWFKAGLDFLIGWQPYHYDGRVSISIGASYSFQLFGAWKTIGVELSADLHIWGPEFSGTAHLKLFIISFDISFGNHSPQIPTRIDWKTFKAGSLPASDDICTVTAQGGKVAQGDQPAAPAPSQRDDLGTLNPRELCIAVSSAIPIRQGRGALLSSPSATVAPPGGKPPLVGIAPLNKAHGDWEAILEITITLDTNDVSAKFQVSPVWQNVPSALWDQTFDPATRKDQLINNVLSGFQIRPIFHEPDNNLPIASMVHGHGPLQTQLPVLAAFSAISSVKDVEREQVIKDSLRAPTARMARQALLDGVLPETAVDMSGMTVEALRALPRIVRKA